MTLILDNANFGLLCLAGAWLGYSLLDLASLVIARRVRANQNKE